MSQPPLSAPFPTGTITFLFSDIEGSTKLWELHPQIMQVAVAKHDALLRQAVQENQGYLFKTTGDGIAAAFSVAEQGLAAALATQQTLAREAWSEPVVLRSRMGLHTGSAELRDGDYFGSTLNRCARLMSAGHGGQILLSLSTQELVRDVLPKNVTLFVLGEHRLKDLIRPETIYQLVHPALLDTFPALRTLNNPSLPNNLPQQLTSFIGREKPLADVAEMLGKNRLLTLTGTGGTGKTRLSLQVAADALEQYPDGVWLVELASVSDPALVPQTIAAVFGVKEQAGQTISQTLVEHLKERSLLLVLDNCEHLLNACANITALLLRSCPQVKILATSREQLGIAGEQVYRVPSLSLPDPKQTATLETLSQFESVRLFIDRAQAVKPDFTVTNSNAPALAQLCYRLDGIPLALELAAARARLLAVEQINDRLAQRFRLLTGGDRSALPRQQTLRALIDWSYDLLTNSEKALLCRLSAFAGGWTLSAAESVCGFEPVEDWEVLDLLTSLADKSLIIADIENADSRYRMLETVRQYADEKLQESEEAETVQERHVEWCLALLQEADPKLKGPEQVVWLDRLELEHDNLRAALDACATGTGTSDEFNRALAGLKLAGAAEEFWNMRGYLSEGRVQLSRALNGQKILQESITDNNAILIKTTIANTLHALGYFTNNQGDYSASKSLYEESLALKREIGDKIGTAYVLCSMGNTASLQGDYSTARLFLEDGLIIYREIGDHVQIANIQSSLGNISAMEGNYSLAISLYEESLSFQREIGNTNRIAYCLSSLGSIFLELSDYSVAQSFFEESLPLARKVGDKAIISHVLGNMATMFAIQGNYSVAQSYMKEGLIFFRELGDKRDIAYGLEGMSLILKNTGIVRHAVMLVAAAEAIRENIGSPLTQQQQAELDTELVSLRSQLSEEEFTTAWAEGSALSWEQAVEFALNQG
ncbi:MAG: tetratricopeptide repeat protein [Armatimonas sp.]